MDSVAQPVRSCYAAAAFGLEGLVADELKRIGMQDVRAENGGVRFAADTADLFRCNLLSRFSDRMFMLLAEGECRTFEDLFQLVSGVSWETLADGTEAFNISAKCVRSQLMSPRGCQSVTKKALLERLKKNTRRNIFPEKGADFPVQVSLRNDHALVLLNTSGASLSRRGYRTWNGEAPLRETLAAALVALSPWHPGLPLHDPCCGTGTIPIEAALMQLNRAPGRSRAFAMESFAFSASAGLEQIRRSCREAEKAPQESLLSGSDMDPEPLELARRHLRQADLSGVVSFECLPLQQLSFPQDRGVMICNPPYGERLENQTSCRQLYRDLGILKARHPGWSLCAITSDPAFERFFGKRADKKRRLYNGRLECTYYIYR